MAILNNNPLIGSGGNQGYNINNSLRFRSSASAYLSRTPASAGNRKTWTWSGWVKRGTLGVSQYLFSAGTGGTDVTQQGLNFQTDDTLRWTGATTTYLLTTQVFRDPSAWYHIVFAFDTTQATANDRQKIYINGTQITAFTTQTNPTQNLDYAVNQAAAFNIGRWTGATNLFDGYLAEVNFIDGSAKTPSDFGETDTITGVWKPKAYTGTYGTNGFYLKFSDIATTSGSNAGLGKDFSGNSNYWTTNNISVTSGTTYDAMTDSPTNTSATVANYCVLNPLITGNVIPPTEANLKASVTASTNAYFTSSGTIAISSGKWYWECSITARDANAGQWFQFGIVSSTTTYTNNAIGYSGNMSNAYAYFNDGVKAGNGTSTVGYGATFTTGDIIGIAFDADAGTITFYKNNVSQGQAFSGISSSLSWLPVIQIYRSTGTTNTSVINFGQRPFSYTPPTGFVALNTYNLPDSTIKKGNTNFDVLTYTGNGATSRSFTGLSFQPDLIWNKDRTTAYSHRIVDSVRGVRKELYSNSTDQELDQWSTYGSVNSFDSNGYTITTGGTAGNFIANLNGDAQVAWIWKANGSTSSNTSGSITSTVSVNATAGFSIVTYTGTQVNATVGHGLGVAPKMVIVKRRSVSPSNWVVWHTAIPNTDYLLLNTTAAKGTLATVWNSTTPTSTTFSIGTDADVNSNSATIVAYCFAEIAGFSKFGSYTGNGSTDGPFVFTNLKPKFIMIKRTDTTSNWTILDTAREGYNVDNDPLYPNLSDAEGTADLVDILSNGFKLRSTDTSVNANAGTYIYACFATDPFSTNNRAR